MRFTKLTAIGNVSFCSALLFVVTAGTPLMGQLQGVESPLQNRLSRLNKLHADDTQQDDQPYKVTSRFHLLEGTTSGYLVLQVELPEGSYMYSLNQGGAITPTKIEVADSEQFVVDGKFNPDRPAEVIEKDPVFQQRLEKHKGKVQFFVPVKFNAGTEIGQVQPELVLNGQVCSTDGVCMQIRDKKVQAEFGGYFGRTVEMPESQGAPLVR